MTTTNPRLFALEKERDRFIPRPDYSGSHAAIGKKLVAFGGDSAGLGGRHLQNVMIPSGFALQFLAAVNGGAVLAIHHVFIEEGVARPFVLKVTSDRNVALPLINRHRTGLNNGLSRKI